MKMRFTTDLLIIGSGLAGLRAAIEAKLGGGDVLLVSRSPIGQGNNTAMAKTIVSFLGQGDSPQLFANDITRVGADLNHEARVSSFVGALEEQRQFILSCPIELTADEEGNPKFIRIPGHTADRIYRQRQRKGVRFVGPIAQRARELGVPMLAGVEISELHLRNGRVIGATGFDKTGEPVSIAARAVLLASGGLAGMFRNNDNAFNSNGDGYGLALELGLKLRDMEFVQFYPTGYLRDGRCRNSVSYEHMVMEGGVVLRNSLGEDIRERHHLQSRLECTRDRLSRAIGCEIYEGRGIGPEKNGVLFDLRGISDPAMWAFYRPHEVPEELTSFAVAPMAHFTMGGIDTDPNGKTAIAGLWAAGELLGGLHGANRIAGVALAECLVTGTAAARDALSYLKTAPTETQPIPDSDLVYRAGAAGQAELEKMLTTLRQIMSSHVGAVRDDAGLAFALDRLCELRTQARVLSETEHSADALRMTRILAAATAVTLSARARRETRGAHCRLDYPESSAAAHHTITVVQKNGEAVVGEEPV